MRNLLTFDKFSDQKESSKIFETQHNDPKSGSFREKLDTVIDKIEGGYYNPEWHPDSRMGKSGETLYGFDRKNAPKLVSSKEGQEFWLLVDKNKNQKTWKRYYKPTGELEKKLKSLLEIIMKNHYNRLRDNNFDTKTKQLILSHPGLEFHFIYAAWNGPGWFSKWAKLLSNRVSQGINSASKLFDLSLSDRLSSASNTIKKSGRIIGELFSNL
jgi:hypothetical protein